MSLLRKSSVRISTNPRDDLVKQTETGFSPGIHAFFRADATQFLWRGLEGRGRECIFSRFKTELACAARRTGTLHCVIPPRTQHVILSVLTPSYKDDGKSWNESSEIGIINHCYSWLLNKNEFLFDSSSSGPRVTLIRDSYF